MTFWERIAGWLTMEDDTTFLRNEIASIRALHDELTKREAEAAFEIEHWAELLAARERDLAEVRAEAARAAKEFGAVITILRHQLNEAIADRDAALAFSDLALVIAKSTLKSAKIFDEPSCAKCSHILTLHKDGPCEGGSITTAGLECCRCVKFEAVDRE